MQHPLLFSICAFLMLLVVLTGIGYRYFYKPGKFLRQLGSPVIVESARTQVLTEPMAAESSSVSGILRQLGSRVQSSGAETASLRTLLTRAGYRNETALPVFNGIRVIGAAVMFLACLALQRGIEQNFPMKMAIIGFGVAVGWILPKFVLEKKITKRQTTLRLSLPDMLDLLVVSIEAGLGLDQAIFHVSHELQLSHPALADEMSLVIFEMRAGKRRSDALRNLADRTGESEIRKLVAILVQNDRFGTSMGESLRTHSDFMRTKRRQEAEERAGKVGVKLVFPIFFCILPSMLVVAAGPGILQIFKYLFPMMRQI